MKHRITVQIVDTDASSPTTVLLRKWANAALKDETISREMTLRIVDIAEMTTLNETYRQKKGPTNVLSFPSDLPPEYATGELGDIVICASIVNQEADMQQKLAKAHWAHMVVHGVYHLLGYDHMNDKDAAIMEALEIKVLATLGFANPYEMEKE